MSTVIHPPVGVEAAVVGTRQGAVRGTVSDGVYVFRGIPYAAPPFGANHLRPPQPVEAWTGVRDALEFGPEPPQPRMPAGADGAENLVWDPATPGEDCLNLNVWTPALGTGTRLPVFVWIPVGMFEVCSGAAYDGSRFARDGVVCVTINCRVGPEGFLFTDDGTPNCGLLDQIAALEWVRDNIDAFGGDPANVTIAGESAGAMSVGTLLSMPRAEGLFRRAIAESGAAHRVIDTMTARRSSSQLAERLGVEPTVDSLAVVPWERLLAASIELKGDLMAHPDPERWGFEVVASFLPWQPVIDGDVVPERPIDRIAAGASGGVDVVVGSNTEDWKMFRVLGGDLERVTDDVLTGPVEVHGYLAAAAYGLPDGALAAYRAMYPGVSPGELLAAIETDWWCRIPGLRLAEAHAGDREEEPTGVRGGTWMYEFAWPSPAFGGLLGACHALEIPFVFDTLDLGPRQMVGALLGPEPPQVLATEMHGAWVRFAATGDPGWPSYDLVRRATKRFDVASTVVQDPRAVERALWHTLL
jgi:para-nitrobenzyl esterase